MIETRRRIQQIVFMPEVFCSLFSGKYEVIADELPTDAKRVGAGYDSREDVFWVNVESDSFDPVIPGSAIPRRQPATVRDIERGQT